MAPVYDTIFNKTSAEQLRILIYSGDTDMLIIPLASTRYCFAQLGRKKIISGFRPWRVNAKTAGYIETFDRFSLANIRGAGNEMF